MSIPSLSSSPPMRTYTDPVGAASQGDHSETPSYPLPVINMSPFIHGTRDQMEEVAEKLGNAFVQTGGAVLLTGLDLTKEKIGTLQEQAEKLFDLKGEWLKNVERKATHEHLYGYNGLKAEKSDGKHPDLKRRYIVSRGMNPDKCPKDVWAKEHVPGLKDAVLGCYDEAYAACLYILNALEIYLKIPEGELINTVGYDGTPISLLHYPELTGEQVQSESDRIGWHQDVGYLTLTLYSDQPGLQILRGEESIDVDYPGTTDSGTMHLVVLGTLLTRITNGKLPSMFHRVKKCEDRGRNSCVLFQGPSLDKELKVPDRLWKGRTDPNLPFTFREHLMPPLKKILTTKPE